MKIDMHCHVREGSLDSKVGVEEYIMLLKAKGFQGMVITDHNTYKGTGRTISRENGIRILSY